jgi:[acyl-carrier-protein] S-malonyltransferase
VAPRLAVGNVCSVSDAKTTALLFPGQGSQNDGMRELVERERPDLLDLAREETGDDPFERAAEATRFTQPAVFCASIAGWERLGRPDARYVAGHSLGEFAALVAAGSMSAGQGLRLVALRGRLMDTAAASDRDGGMLALLGRHAGVAEDIARRNGLTIANDNAPTEVVLSGSGPGLDGAAGDARDEGLRAVRLSVGGAFHSPAMAGAEPEFRAALAEAELRPPVVTAVSGLTARPFDDVRRRLLEGLTRPVRWRETLLSLHELGARRFVETGPGRVLAKLVPRTLGDVEVAHV